VRREDEPDEEVGAVRGRARDGVGDPRRPVLHPHVDGHVELALERGALGLGDLVERRDADPAVARDELVDRLLRDRPPAADVGEVGRDVLDARRAPVGHEDDGAPHFRATPVTIPARCARHPRGIRL
jgi:hypothetical protein